MNTRHIAREISLQTLFELDMKDSLSTSDQNIDEILKRNRDEGGSGIKDLSFAKNIVSNVISRIITIDDILTKAAPDWPIDKIGVVDRNVLRIGLSELLFGDREDVPPKVAIDESIELAKTYGGETSGKFVNGVLGAVYKELGEPDKDQKSKKKDITNTDGKYEELAGACVFSKKDGLIYVALVHDVFGYWTLPKGHVSKDEDKDLAVTREIKKEIGIDGKVIEKVGENRYIANKPEKGKVVKHVNYFLMTSDYKEIKLEEKAGLDDSSWKREDEIEGLRMYDDIKSFILKGRDIVKEKNLL